MTELPFDPEKHESNKANRMQGDKSVIQVPSVGRLCHYFAYGTPGGEYKTGQERAAIITEVDRPGDPLSPVGLAVLNPTGLFFNQHIEYGPGQGGHWGWPKYVPPIVIDPKAAKREDLAQRWVDAWQAQRGIEAHEGE